MRSAPHVPLLLFWIIQNATQHRIRQPRKAKGRKQTSTLDWISKQHGAKGVICEHLGMVLGKYPPQPGLVCYCFIFSFRGVRVYQLLQVLVSIPTLISNVDSHLAVRLYQFEYRPCSSCLGPFRLPIDIKKGDRHLFSQLTSQRCTSSTGNFKPCSAVIFS